DRSWVDTLDAESRDLFFTDSHHEQQEQEQAKRYIHNYFELESPAGIEPAGRELRLEAVFDEVRVVGVLDRIDRSADGTWIISDYKTGRAPELERSLGNFFGLEVYAALFHEVFGSVPA